MLDQTTKQFREKKCSIEIQISTKSKNDKFSKYHTFFELDLSKSLNDLSDGKQYSIYALDTQVLENAKSKILVHIEIGNKPPETPEKDPFEEMLT